MVFDDLSVRQDVGQRLEALLLRQHGVELLPGEGVVEDAEEAVAFREVVVHQVDQVIRLANRLDHLSEIKTNCSLNTLIKHFLFNSSVMCENVNPRCLCDSINKKTPGLGPQKMLNNICLMVALDLTWLLHKLTATSFDSSGFGFVLSRERR